MRFYRTDVGAGEARGKRAELGMRGGFTPIAENPRQISLDAIRAAGGEVERNGSASILDLGDGVFCLEYHGKMNAIDQDTVAMTMSAVDRAERDGVALVIGNDAPDAFCAGANLFGLMVALGQGNMQVVDGMVVAFQNACARTRYARVPVVAAPFGLTLGGGAEIVMGCQTVRAAAELYLGCVEVGVGLIPAGGGCMEMAARAAARATDDPQFDLLALVRVPFLNLATARVSTSAEEARDLAYLRQGDSVSMARETLIADAKELALGIARAGYRPPPPRMIRVIGESGAATLRTALHNLQGVHQISEHDAKVERAPGAHPLRRRGPGRHPGQRAAPPRPRARGVPLAVRGTEDPRAHPIHVGQEQASAELRSKPMRDVAILSAVRTAVGRAPRGVFKNTRPDDLAALVRARPCAARRFRPPTSRTSCSAARTPKPSRG